MRVPRLSWVPTCIFMFVAIVPRFGMYMCVTLYGQSLALSTLANGDFFLLLQLRLQLDIAFRHNIQEAGKYVN